MTNEVLFKPKLLFTEKSIPLIVEALGFIIDKNGYVRGKNGRFEKNVNGKKFKATQIIGVTKYLWITELS